MRWIVDIYEREVCGQGGNDYKALEWDMKLFVLVMGGVPKAVVVFFAGLVLEVTMDIQ